LGCGDWLVVSCCPAVKLRGASSLDTPAASGVLDELTS
jgi:hypothetical protein